MKVYTVEIEYEVEEDFGGFQTHRELQAVFGSREEAEKLNNSSMMRNLNCLVKEWEIYND